MTRISPFLWYHDKAEEAAAFYASVIPDSWVDRAWGLGAETPSGPPGTVRVVEFTLAGRPFVAMAAPGAEPFSQAVSLLLECDTQAEIDRLWDALSAGGATQACGWLRDRYGLSWQIAPRTLFGWMADPDPDAARRTAEAMLSMRKLDLAALERAHAGG